MTKTKRHRGRPTKYNPKTTPQEVKEYCEKGLINVEIAKKLGIDVSVFYVWQEKYSDMQEAIKAGKSVIDDKVEQALYKRTMGTMYKETTKERNEQGRMVTVRTVKKWLPPDVTAHKFWLNNRRPQDYRERKEITGPEGGPIGIVVLPPKMTADEYKEYIENANGNRIEEKAGDSLEPAAEASKGIEQRSG